MINIRDSSKRLLAILDLYTDSAVVESINGEYTAKFTAIIDEDGKSQYIQHGNLVEIEGQYYNIVQHRRTRGSDGALLVSVFCQQVAYDLNRTTFEEFVQSGTPEQLLNLLLPGTGFTVGIVQPTEIISVEFRELATARGILLEIAAQAGVELLFDKYEISLLHQRGQQRGVQFRLGKNLMGIVKDSNISTGTQVVSYEIDIVELNTLPEFAGLEYFELGDTVRIIDEELGINELQRIIRYEYDPRRRIKSKVTIAAHMPSITNQFVRLSQTTVAKDRFYYGNRFGPEIGFESIRSDKKARSVFNADEFRMQRGDGSGSSWTDAVYFDPEDGEYKFTGKVIASSFEGGSIQIGLSFRVDSSGHMVATGAEFSGSISASIITGGQIIGPFIATALSGQRIEFSSAENLLRAINESGSSLAIKANVGTTPDIEFENAVGDFVRLFLLPGVFTLSTTTSNTDITLASGRGINLNPAGGYKVRLPMWDSLYSNSAGGGSGRTMQQELDDIWAAIASLSAPPPPTSGP